MGYRATFLVGAAVGYVLGARAGRERYEQIKRMSRQFAQHPTVQEAAGVIRAQAEELVDNARNTIMDRMPDRLRRESEPPEGVPPLRVKESTPARHD